ncbi:hypothetical protein GCM10022225_15490 [Plantactinospora mayteni]|uniref:Uncharacterized protein n=1 Tax=Plantactinospora mayteni TaxID=566021 RepID=A0ABQ4EFX3_9ACTN|nr:hypothetical protein [Plantactinospora mayteni]GIG93623.1 hypothetical protein Pma05_01960 [Plantactinospora mayteni]
MRLDITYPEYLDAMLLTRGLIHWPYLYADPNDPGFGYAQADLRRDVDFLARTFPRDDFSDLRARADILARARDQA